MLHVTEITKIRRQVLSELAKMAFEGTLEDNVKSILNTVVTESGTRYRCCVHKERAVLKERINLALGQDMSLKLQQAAKNAVQGKIVDMPIVNVIPEACDQCPLDKFVVTDACRNCIAHNCIASCPHNAIKVIHNRAYIDKGLCIECGLCKRSCRYSAIIEISRPCERACALKAIQPGTDRRVNIDYDKCVACGNCKLACPFGAIDDQSLLVQIIQKIKSGHKLIAILAPSFVGQFGAKVKPIQVVRALKQLGFADVREVAVGADAVAAAEAVEFKETVPNERKFMTTSCCPAFVDMVEKHVPELKENVSHTPSPMVMLGQMLKQEDSYAQIVFIGPCTAKKEEAKRSSVIDFALTFEEVYAMMEGAGIDLQAMSDEMFDTDATYYGNMFACAGGVAKAVIHAAAEQGLELTINSKQCDGLDNCKVMLLQAKAGKLGADLIEGMACSGGCVNGPGAMADYRVTSKLVERFASTKSSS